MQRGRGEADDVPHQPTYKVFQQALQVFFNSKSVVTKHRRINTPGDSWPITAAHPCWSTIELRNPPLSQGNLLCIVILRPLLILDKLLSHNSFPPSNLHYEIHFLARRPNKLPLDFFHSPNFEFPQTQFSGSPVALQQNASCNPPSFLSTSPKDPTDHPPGPPPHSYTPVPNSDRHPLLNHRPCTPRRPG